MDAIDYRYEEILDRLSGRKKIEYEAEQPREKHTVYDIIGECEECGAEIFNDSCEHFYSGKLGIFLCEHCVSSRWGKMPKGTVS